MLCPEKTRLQDLFAAAIDHHAKMIKALHNVSSAGFDKALRDAASSREAAEIARLAVEDHRAIHRC
ncbi:MAG TPA: hypothetical protein VNH18_23145 [Bryobacteraceae bacterium]|nr:hypothetical protein [Bryobacteraceae bacterium]HXJ42194.1 hypothetical protein [Bryobacteraceae bacterium]